jgi:hypothetical protein
VYETIGERVLGMHGDLQKSVSEWATDEAKIAEIHRVMAFGGSRNPALHGRRSSRSGRNA